MGLNCIRGPHTMLPLLERIRATCDGPRRRASGARTGRRDEEPTFQSLTDPRDVPGDRPFPTALDPFICTRDELGEFAAAAHALGVSLPRRVLRRGAAPHPRVAEALGRTPPASRYSADMSRHAFFGSDARLKDVNRSYAGDL